MMRGSADLLLPEKIRQMKCETNGRMECDLTKSRPCAKCRYVKFATLKIEIDAANNELDESSVLTQSLLEIVKLKKVAVREGKKKVDDALSILIRRRQVKEDRDQKPTIVPGPSDFQSIMNERMRWRVMRVDEDYAQTRYQLRWENLQGKIPDDENQFWGLVTWCIENLAQWKLPFALSLAGELKSVSHLDMCRLIESSYALMFYAETALPHRTAITESFGRLFVRMGQTWHEVYNIIGAMRNIVSEIRKWEPSKEEFSFLLAMIVCVSTHDQNVSLETEITLRRLEICVNNAARAHLVQSCGEERAQSRLHSLLATVDLFRYLRDIRRHALRQFYRRDSSSALAYSTVYPVVASVCNHFRQTQQWPDYFQPEPTFTGKGSEVEMRSKAEQFTREILSTL